MPYAIAFLGLLAFVGWVLWLRERRVETVSERLAAWRRDFDASLARFEVATTAANQNADQLQRAANDVKAIRDEWGRFQLGHGLRRPGRDPVLAMPQTTRE
jgi:hypothetical protein